MTKRKLSGGEAAPAKEAADNKEQEQEGLQADDFAPGPIDTNPLQFLIAPTELSAFTSDIWERKPLHIAADEERKAFFDGLFDFDALVKLADGLEAAAMILMDKDPGPKGDALTFDDDVDDSMARATGPLVFGRDVVAVRYTDGKRQTIDADFADSDTLRSLYETAGATLQVHQPQRFINGIWRLVAALEAQAGCLVGCNAYITPRGGQGLAPHHDDVELFVCQTRGTKKWRLYKPVDGFELPSKCSGDLPQEGLGDPILEVTMKPGDVLYVPRGFVHQAEAQEEGSCHLTISTYQNWTWGSLAGKLIETAQESSGSAASALPLELRRGLPLGIIFKHGLQADIQAGDKDTLAAAARPDAAALAAGLRALADHLEKGPLELLTPAVDELSLDFLAHRMPPHPCQLLDQGEEPTLEHAIACRGKNLFRLVPCEPEDKDMMSDEEDEDEEDEDDDQEEGEGKKVPMVKLVTCLPNNRYSHMINVEEDDSDDDHDDGHGMCMLPGCGDKHSSSEEEEEEEEEKEDTVEEEEEEEEGKKGAKKAEKKGAKTEEENKVEEKKGAEAKKGGKKAAGKKEEEEEGDEAEIVEMDVDELESGGEDEDSDDENGEEEDEDEEDTLSGPIFPAQYAPVLAEVLASTLERPLPIKQLKVPSNDDGERLRLVQILYEAGFVVTVEAAKEAAKDPSPAKEKVTAKDEKTEEGKKGKKGGKGNKEEAAEEGEKGKGKAKEEGKEKASPPAKKAKKAK